MARFEGEVRETFTLPADLERARDHFADLETIAKHYGALESYEVIDDTTIRFVLEKQAQKGVSYQGIYTCRYTKVGDDRLEWSTVASDNMWSTGNARFVAQGERTRVEYFQRIETEMPVPRLLGKVVKPIVGKLIADGVRSYLDRMKRAL